ncbi:PAS domain-containing protein [Orrella marina]|uniref:PAS domain S-box-containing protein/diguanylate cyclase (GGDEF) domain-containing protein n=1 Tax=Orrella marina TaxID=2163011 RepID=A0A2R4XND3_9BURK|nr:PAS domain-containing protein [Orrella marina]AWB35322.1 hypothetical protein DBV39_18030 [Orrella marina]
MNKLETQRQKLALYPVLVAAVLLILLIAYWAHLFASYDTMRSQVRHDTLRLASQTAHALSLQANTLFRKLDYFSLQLTEAWLSDNPAFFDRSVRVAMRTLPQDALVQIAVADAQGEVVYSQLTDGPVQLDRQRPVNIADREHFQVHLGGDESTFYISEPILGRISNTWTVQFTRGLWKDGVFGGVLVLAVSASHLSAALASTFPDEDDVALIVRSDGTYIARSRELEGVFGTRLPPDRPFLTDPESREGAYEVVAAVDGVKRLYAWWRGQDYPFVLAVGYGTDKSLDVTEQAISESIEQNAIGSATLVLAIGIVLWMWIQRSRQTASLKEAELRLKLALSGGRLAAWDWQVTDDELTVDGAWAVMFGFDNASRVKSSRDWMDRLHPEDRSRAVASLHFSLADPAGLYDAEYRVIGDDGSTVWISDRGEVVERDEQGSPVRMVGVKQDITQRKNAQQAEESIRHQLSKLVAEIPGAVIQFRRDPQGQFSFPFASPAIRQIYGVSPDQVVMTADEVFKAIHPLDVARVRDSIEESARTLYEWHTEYRVVRPDGQVRWISGHSRPERLEDGSVIWHGYLQDVTTDREVAEALKANEAHLRFTLQAVHDGLWSYDHDADVATWDERIRELLGHVGARWQQPALDDLLTIIHPQDVERLSREAVELFSRHSHDVIWMDFRLQTLDQRWLWVQARGRVVEWNDDGSPRKTVGILSDISERVAGEQLRQALLNRSPAAIALINHRREVIETNEQFKALFLPQEVSITGLDLRSLHIDDDHERMMAQAYVQLGESKALRMDFPLRDVEGTIRWFDMHGVLQDTSDPHSPIIWTMTDITARHAADQALSTERQRLRMLLQRFPGGVLIEDADERIVFANERWCDLMGLSISPQSMVGLSHEGLEDLIGSDRAQWHHESLRVARRGENNTIEVNDGNGSFMELEHLEIAKDEQHTNLGTVWFVWDITERKQHENRLNQLAMTDPLTGLANRRSFMQALTRHVQTLGKDGHASRGVILMLDIDHFKKVNDTYGHADGDQVLKHLASTFKAQIRAHDLAGRLGGEEFAILLTAVDEADGRLVAERIRQAVQVSQVVTSNAVIRITISIGLAVVTAESPDELLKRADKALYKAKQLGRNRVCDWESEV